VHPIHAISENTLRVEERKKKVDDGRRRYSRVEDQVSSLVRPEERGRHADARSPRQDHRDGGRLVRTAPRFLSADHPPRYRWSIDRWRARGNGEWAQADFDEKMARRCCSTCMSIRAPVWRSCSRPRKTDLNDDYSRMLFRMSSPLPAHLAKFAGDKGYTIADGSRGFIFNGDPQCVVDFFEIGTRPSWWPTR